MVRMSRHGFKSFAVRLLAVLVVLCCANLYLVRVRDKPSLVRKGDCRSKSDGYFRSAGNLRAHIFLFSAFWDDRWSVGQQPVIRVLAVMETTYVKVPYAVRILSRSRRVTPRLVTTPVYCYLTCRNKTGMYQVQVESQDYVRLGPFREVQGRGYGRYIISCAQTTCMANHWDFKIKIGNQLTQKKADVQFGNGDSVPVEFSAKPEDPSGVLDFVNCHPVAFNHLDPTRLVEWLEMQRILGIGKVIMYNDSLDESTSRVLRHYESEGFMEVRQTRPLFVTEDGSLDMEDYGLRNGISVTDCMYRYMYQVKYIVSLDADEVIMPRISSDLNGLLYDIHKIQLQGNATKVGSYVFRNMNFLTDAALGAKPDQTKPSNLHYLRYRKRHPVSDPKYHPKVIVNAMGCIALYQHHCRRLTDAFNTTELNTELSVDPMIGALHHYRGSLCDLRKQIEIKCKDSTIKVLQDDVMLQYEEALSQAVTSQMTRIGLNKFQPKD